MQWTNVYIDATACRLGDSVDLREAVADGRYDRGEYDENGLSHIVVAADGEYPADMAVSAAQDALKRARVVRPEDLGMFLHASVYFQGQEYWTPASYVQQHTTGGQGTALEIRQTSNGGMAALALGAAQVTTDPARAVMLTTADRFGLPGIDRFRSDKGLVLADGATAMLLTSKPGIARVLSTVLTGDGRLENLYRGATFRAANEASGWPLDLRGRKKRILERGNLQEIVAIIAGQMQRTVAAALDDAGLGIGDISRFVFPHTGRTIMEWEFLAAFDIDESATTWDWGRTIGHIGAGDQYAGLNHLLETGAVGPGDRVALCGSGIGFNWGCAILEVLDEPGWS